MSASITIKNMGIKFGEVQILPEVSLKIKAGECFGLVGESGSGKSTVLRCMSLLLKSWSGDVFIDGVNVRDMEALARCGTMQMVFQDPYGSLHPRHSVRTVLSEPLRIHKIDNIDERIEQTILDVGLPLEFIDRYPHQLSGGQRQRIAIARALILEPSILLLDEPTSALDVSVQAEILNLLQKLQEEKGFTYIIVSHDLAVVDHMCDRFAVMQSGNIVEVLSREAIPNNNAKHPYARELIGASLEYERAI